MYILTRSGSLENCIDNIYRVQAMDLEMQYPEAGYQRCERSYKLQFRHREFTVICPEFRNAAHGAEPVVILPDFAIPRRPYPIYVYLYAIDLYSRNPNMGQREAAKTTRERFGLESFAHTTLGRALKSFVHNQEAVEKPTETCPCDAPGDTVGEDKRHEANSTRAVMQEGGAGSRPGFPSTRLTASLRRRTARILCGEASQGNLLRAITFCLELARVWFKRYHRFLL